MKKCLVLLLLPALMILQYCSPSKKSAKVQVAKTTFMADVTPLVTTSCAPCHTTGNKSHLLEYPVAVKEADDIIARVSLNPGEKGFMPFKHDKLSDSAINVFVKWKADGLLEK